jgi:hypothetical protein
MTHPDLPGNVYAHPTSRHSSAYSINGTGIDRPPPLAQHLNPAAGHFQPCNSHDMSQLDSLPSCYLERKVDDLERDQDELRVEFKALRMKCNEVDSKLDALKKGGWDVQVGPFKDQSTARFKQELDAITRDIKGENHGASEYENAESLPPQTHASSINANVTSSLPPHLRARNGDESGPAPQPANLRHSIANGSAAFRSMI